MKTLLFIFMGFLPLWIFAQEKEKSNGPYGLFETRLNNGAPKNVFTSLQIFTPISKNNWSASFFTIWKNPIILPGFGRGGAEGSLIILKRFYPNPSADYLDIGLGIGAIVPSYVEDKNVNILTHSFYCHYFRQHFLDFSFFLQRNFMEKMPQIFYRGQFLTPYPKHIWKDVVLAYGGYIEKDACHGGLIQISHLKRPVNVSFAGGWNISGKDIAVMTSVIVIIK